MPRGWRCSEPTSSTQGVEANDTRCSPDGVVHQLATSTMHFLLRCVLGPPSPRLCALTPGVHGLCATKGSTPSLHPSDHWAMLWKERPTPPLLSSAPLPLTPRLYDYYPTVEDLLAEEATLQTGPGLSPLQRCAKCVAKG